MSTKQKIVSISMDPEQHKALKKEAIDRGETLSHFLINSAVTVINTDPSKFVKIKK